ncbi:hypothetical protein DMA11_15195 [Marinilabiliaceae bacterium JC017]|nr:hypothetical protein DMA11_15195 [Marinilabiliaceae bacterium JC017]
MKHIRQITIASSLLLLLLFALWSTNWFVPLILFSVLFAIFYPPSSQWLLIRWKKLTDTQKTIAEWAIAILISVITLLFLNTYIIGFYRISSSSMANTYSAGDLVIVNKLKAGPAININQPQTFKRLTGWNTFSPGDVIMFHFPEADTILVNHPNENYHYLQRQYQINNQLSKPEAKDNISFCPVTKRPTYLKRIIALPGDTLTIRDNKIKVNHKPLKFFPFTSKYLIKEETPASLIAQIRKNAINQYVEKGKNFVEIYKKGTKTNAFDEFLKEEVLPLNLPDLLVFPFAMDFFWNAHNLGPVVIPQKGQQIELTIENLPLYKRIISVYENNTLELTDNHIIINGKQTNHYRFKMNYYWVMGDNRPHSYDSRYWGFVPDNHIIGIVGTTLFSSGK